MTNTKVVSGSRYQLGATLSSEQLPSPYGQKGPVVSMENKRRKMFYAPGLPRGRVLRVP
jgi:hypothetical protein